MKEIIKQIASLEIILRIIVDAMLVNFAFLAAQIIRFLIEIIANDGEANYRALLFRHLELYISSSLLLTLISVFVFFINGFYTYGRTYNSKYKILVVFQSTLISYLIYSLIVYLFYHKNVDIAIIFISWILTFVLIFSIRLIASIWRIVVFKEVKLRGKPLKNYISNVVVLGGAGYIGSVLVHKLLNHGYYVTVLDSLLYGDEGIRNFYHNSKFELIKGDIRNISDIVKALEFADAVVHLAAIVGDPACDLNERLTIQINQISTRVIAEIAKGFGVKRFIFASTCSVYGASERILDESSLTNPLSLYAQTKLESEKILLKLADENFAPVILRLATVYGMSPRPRFDLIVNLLTMKALLERKIEIYGGDQWRPFVHVEDVAESILKCLEAPIEVIRGQVFNVGSNEQNYQISEIGKIIKSIIPDTELIHVKENIDKRNYKVSFDKIHKKLGFYPRLTLKDGILEIKQSIENGYISDPREAKYFNHRALLEKPIFTFENESF